MDNDSTVSEVKLPYIKYSDNLYASTLDNIPQINLASLHISQIILVGKYLKKEHIPFPNENTVNNIMFMHFEYDDSNPSENFLFGFKSIVSFINDKPTLLLTESDTCVLTPALGVAYLLVKGIQLQQAKTEIKNSSLIIEEHMKLLENYERHLHIKQPECYYKCGKCRSNLFNDMRLIFLHEFTPKANYSYKRHKKNLVQTTECTSYFLNNGIEEDDAFMKIDNGGKILCKKCGNKLGEFLPKGTQCSCGSWVVPAVQIVKSKVDKIKYVYS